MRKVKILGKEIDMSDTMALFEAELERIEIVEYIQDTMDDYGHDELVQMVREGVITWEELEAGLRRNYDRKAA